jgi:hypothetical protein
VTSQVDLYLVHFLASEKDTEERKTRNDGAIQVSRKLPTMLDPKEHLIMVLSLKVNSKVKARVAERVNAGKCLGQLDSGEQCECSARTRGLCEKCHYKWRMIRLRMDGSKAAVFDSKLIQLGRLLSANGAKAYRNKSVFAKVAREAS